MQSLLVSIHLAVEIWLTRAGGFGDFNSRVIVFSSSCCSGIILIFFPTGSPLGYLSHRRQENIG